MQIPASAKFYLPIVHLNRKDQNKEKEAVNGPSSKKAASSKAKRSSLQQILSFDKKGQE